MRRSSLHLRFRELALAISVTVAAIGFLALTSERGSQTAQSEPAAMASTTLVHRQVYIP